MDTSTSDMEATSDLDTPLSHSPNGVTQGAKMSPLHYSETAFFKSFVKSTWVIYPIVGVFIGIANLITISAVIKYKRLRTSTNVLIVSLAFADLLNCPAMILVKMHNYIGVIYNNEIYLKLILGTAQALHVISLVLSIINFFLLALERWLAITFPIKFRMGATVKKTMIICSCAWFYGLTVCGSIIFYYSWSKPMSFYRKPFFLTNLLPKPVFIFIAQVHIYFCLTVSVILYISVLIQMKKRSSSFSHGDTDATVSQNTNKVTQMTSLVLAVFIIIWLPYCIVTEIFPDVVSTSLEGVVAFQIFLYFLFTNSFINVFIYAWRSEAFNQAFAQMLCRRHKDNDLAGSQSTIMTVSQSTSLVNLSTNINK